MAPRGVYALSERSHDFIAEHAGQISPSAWPVAAFNDGFRHQFWQQGSVLLTLLGGLLLSLTGPLAGRTRPHLFAPLL